MLESQKAGLDNLRKIQGQGCIYRLENYAPGLSELSIHAHTSGLAKRSYRITFQTTFYVQLPINWERADFQLASPEQQKDLTDKLDLSEAQKDQLLLITVVPPVSPDIFILCHKVFVSEEISFP